jgi:hypothetical protein
VLGDLCTKTSDCCGGDAPSGLPGAGLVKCVPVPGFTQIGTCSAANPNNCPNNQATCKNTCQPEGDVCHYLGNGGCSSNSFPNNCCDATGNKGACKLDKLGVPRCYGLAACAMTGQTCASAADCCNNLPCLPDSTGHLKCGSMACVPAGGTCTTTADCCTGLPCVVPPGSLGGTCTPISMPPPDGGSPVPDGGTPPPADMGACALYGQACSATTSCCNGVTCLRPPTAGSTACGASDTDCLCYNNIIM